MKFKTKRLVSLMLALVMMMSFALTACGSSPKNIIPMTFTNTQTGQKIQATYNAKEKSVVYSSDSDFDYELFFDSYVGLCSGSKYDQELQIIASDYDIHLKLALSDPVSNGLVNKIRVECLSPVESNVYNNLSGRYLSYVEYKFNRDKNGRITSCDYTRDTDKIVINNGKNANYGSVGINSSFYTYTYKYDNSGRIISHLNEVRGGDNTDAYNYSNGQFTSVITTAHFDPPEKTTYSVTYANNKPVSITDSNNKKVFSFEYDGDKLSKCTSDRYIYSFQYKNGMVDQYTIGSVFDSNEAPVTFNVTWGTLNS